MKKRVYPSATENYQIMRSVTTGGCLFFISLFTGTLCHLLAIDLLYGPISIQVLTLPTTISKVWENFAGPGVIPFLMIIGGLLIMLFGIFQLYQSVFKAISRAGILSRRGLLFSKVFSLLLIFMGFGPLFSFSLKLAWQSIFHKPDPPY